MLLLGIVAGVVGAYRSLTDRKVQSRQCSTISEEDWPAKGSS
jgi:hypothetical protein